MRAKLRSQTPSFQQSCLVCVETWFNYSANAYVGADVTHPPPGSNSPSYAALVSSVDSFGAKYIASDSIQDARQEMIAGLEGMTEVSLLLDIAASRD